MATALIGHALGAGDHEEASHLAGQTISFGLANGFLAMNRLEIARLDPHPTVASTEAVDVAFWAAVRALPERQRAAVTLYYVEDLAVAEIAEILGIASGTVKTSLYMARRSLAVTLGAEEVFDDND